MEEPTQSSEQQPVSLRPKLFAALAVFTVLIVAAISAVVFFNNQAQTQDKIIGSFFQQVKEGKNSKVLLEREGEVIKSDGKYFLKYKKANCSEQEREELGTKEKPTIIAGEGFSPKAKIEEKVNQPLDKSKPIEILAFVISDQEEERKFYETQKVKYLSYC